MIIRSLPACLPQSPVGDLDDSGAVDVAGQPGGPEGSGTVLTPLQPMSPQRQAMLSSRCYQLSDADCWDLPVDYTKIKRLGDEQDHKEVSGRSTSLCRVLNRQQTQQSLQSLESTDTCEWFMVKIILFIQFTVKRLYGLQTLNFIF